LLKHHVIAKNRRNRDIRVKTYSRETEKYKKLAQWRRGAEGFKTDPLHIFPQALELASVAVSSRA
jgi:hypothetical protein